MSSEFLGEGTALEGCVASIAVRNVEFRAFNEANSSACESMRLRS